jgi:hypothetical protein
MRNSEVIHMEGVAHDVQRNRHDLLYQNEPSLLILNSGVAEGRMRTLKALPSNASSVANPRSGSAEVRSPNFSGNRVLPGCRRLLPERFMPSFASRPHCGLSGSSADN